MFMAQEPQMPSRHELKEMVTVSVVVMGMVASLWW
jgi:hypothetical protein